jgi:DNA-binding transcriptional regulator YiaG
MTDTARSPGRPRVRATRATEASVTLSLVQARLDLSAAGMACYLGVPVATFRNWRDGHREPPSVLHRLLDVLGTVEALAPVIHERLMPGRK